jgi:amino acid transporter
VVPFDTLWDIVNCGVMMSFIIANVSLIMIRTRETSPSLAPKLTAAMVVSAGLSAFLYQEGYENHSSDACLILAIIFLAITVVITIVLGVKCPQSLNAPGLFAAPLVPYIPMICILADWYMITQIAHLALELSCAWVAAAVLSYLAYGYTHSAGRSGWSELLNRQVMASPRLSAPMLSVNDEKKASMV